jgi:hypothetical protein
MLDALANCILKIEHGVRTSKRPEDRVLGEKFLATLAPILAAAELRSNELKDLDAFERLVGNSFLIEPAPFGTYYDDWKSFREQCERLVVSGMTVNERLFALGLLDAFDQFVEAGEWEECRTILRRVYLDDTNIEAIINNHKTG